MPVWKALTVALVLGPFAFGPAPVMAEEVGTAAAVKPSSTGTPPGGAKRNIQVGTRIVADERIETTRSGSLQVMFLDKSTLTVGPNSNVVIDEFVYNPSGNTGEFGVRLLGGALRFVGGQISHNNQAVITTPVATIGIRGGAAFVTHAQRCTANSQGGQAYECTTVVCTGGVCSVRSLIDSRQLELDLSEAVEISQIGAVPFDASSVTLNDILNGGDGSIQSSSGNGGNNANGGDASGSDSLPTQDPEPPAPAPPAPF